MKYLILLTAFINLGASKDNFGRLIIETEESTGLHSDSEGLLSQPRADYYTGQQQPNIQTPCTGLTECIPLSDCTQMLYDAARSCFAGDRSMLCGESEYETFVCCPLKNQASESNTVCGKSLVKGQFYKGLGAFPFVARVGFKNVNTGSLAYPCTGSIISKRVVLTAAHCALAKADGHRLSSVRVGEYDTTRDPDCASDSGFCAPSVLNHAISHVVVHPDYVSGSYHHDIALLVLRTPLNYTVACQPVCLKPNRNDLLVGRRALVVGWGKMSSSTIRAPQMQFLEVPLISWDTCLRTYSSTGALDSSKSVEGQWMCAGGEGRDACQGFGGAPLILKENNIHSQIGIMSFGSDNCGGIRIPSVYTSISHFHQWIIENSPVE